MLIEDSYALLAPLSSNGEYPDVVLSDDGRFEARADALTDGGGMTLLGVNLRHDRSYTYVVIDYTGRVNAKATSDTAAEAKALTFGDLRRMGVSVVSQEPLLADAITGPRRTSVLYRGAGVNVRIKRMNDEEGGAWLQVRAHLDTSAGYIHPVLTDTGQLVCVVSGRTDQDAWLRVQGELNRQGIEFA